jgi:hypothetical protein
VLYAGTGNHTAFALDAATGKKLWRRVTSTGQNNQIAVAGRTVVLTDGDNGGMLGLDAGTGAHPGGSVSSSAVPPARGGSSCGTAICPPVADPNVPLSPGTDTNDRGGPADAERNK